MTREVKVGDRTVTLPALNGFKAVRAARLVAEVARCAPSVNERLAALRSDFADSNALVVTPAIAKLPRFQRVVVDDEGNEHEQPMFTDADFSAAGGEIRIPQDPALTDQIVAVFPLVFEAAEKQVVELLALLLAPNSELADADENGTVDEYLTKHGKQLLHAASLAQLIDIVTAAIETVTEALTEGAGGGALGKAVMTMTGQPTEPQTQPAPTTTVTNTPTQQFTPVSSNASAAPMAGQDATLSTEPVGANLQQPLTG